MTEQELQVIEERWRKATPGPWVADMRRVATECGECGEYAYEVPGVIRCKSDGCGIVDVQESEKQNENAAAIAHAPTDISALLAEVRRLNNELKEAKATIDTHNEMLERQHSEIYRLNELLEMRCANCHLKKESEVGLK